jgi:PIN domain nuclease of toxin-antitoxin system
MTLLLDTHTMLWFFWDDPQLSATAKARLEDPNNRKLVSIASCWEAAIKVGLKKLKLGTGGSDCRGFLESNVTRSFFEYLPISLAHATAVEHLPHHHNDPFDRLLIAQAVTEQIPIVSADTQLDPYSITRLW